MRGDGYGRTLPAASAFLLGFARFVRAAGFAVAPEQVVAFLDAVRLLGPRSMDDIRQGALATLGPSPERLDAFDALLRAWFWGDTAAIVATFEPDGCFREPAGPQFRVCGTTALTGFYDRFFSAGGGIVLEHCSVTEDGVRTALEFNAVRWGGVALPPQAGIAVYERGPSGRIAHARVYDDVAGPVE